VFQNTPHAVKSFPAAALLKRLLWRRLDLLKPTGTKNFRIFNKGEISILAFDYGKGPKWVPTTVLAKTGPVLYVTETKDNLTWRRH